MSLITHQSFQTQIAQSAQQLIKKTHAEDQKTFKSIEVVLSYYGDNNFFYKGLYFTTSFLKLCRYYVNYWKNFNRFLTIKKIYQLKKERHIFYQNNRALTQHCALPTENRIYLSFSQFVDDIKQQSFIKNWQLNITLSLFHEIGHLVNHEPIITTKNKDWKSAILKLRFATENIADKINYTLDAVNQTMTMLPEEMFADCFSILCAELTGWGTRESLCKQTSLWRQQTSYPTLIEDDAELAWMTHYTHTACDLLATRRNVVNNTKDAAELAGLVAWQAWHQLQIKMEQELLFFKTLGIGEGTHSFKDFIARNTQYTPILEQKLDIEPANNQAVFLKPFLLKHLKENINQNELIKFSLPQT